MKQIKTLIKEMGIKGVFIDEIQKRYDIFLRALIELGVNIESFGAVFGVYEGSITFQNQDDANSFANLIENSPGEVKQIKNNKRKFIIYSNEETKPKMITVPEKMKIPNPGFDTFDSAIEAMQGLNRDHPNSYSLSITNQYISFTKNIQRLETEKEVEARKIQEDKDYIKFYKEMSKKFDEYKQMKQVFEGYED